MKARGESMRCDKRARSAVTVARRHHESGDSRKEESYDNYRTLQKITKVYRKNY